jgi:glycosyltransferase involved in cell wall biosynthesis
MNDIICFANDWSSDPLSKKHIMTRFARKRRVLWINSINNRRPRATTKDFRRILQKLQGFRSGLQKVDENIWVLSPLYIPFHGSSICRKLNRWLLRMQIRVSANKLHFRSPVDWIFIPTAADVAGHLGESHIVYQCVDEYSAFSDAAPEVRERERDLLKKSDLVIVSSEKLLESKQKVNANTHLVLHGVDFDHFVCATEPQLPIAPEIKALNKPVLGFVGLIADWVDLPLMAELARLRPEWNIVLIGRSDTDTSVFAGLTNVHLLGPRPYKDLPQFLRGIDVALLPFVQNELTYAANPLKLREYLAAGLPVVSAPLPEVRRFEPLVRLGSTANDYVAAIDEILSSGAAGCSRERAEQVRGESWDNKVRELEFHLDQLVCRETPVGATIAATAGDQ